MSYVVVFAAIALLSLVHELGHAAVARLLGLRITCISVGLGPPFARFRMRGAEVLLCLIPFGGYVRVAELTDEEASPPLGVRLAVTSAGSAMNYAVAAALAVAVALGWGVETGRILGLEVTLVSQHAASQGLRVGDVVTRADKTLVRSVEELQARLEHGRSVELELLRNGRLEQVQVTAAQGQRGLGARYVPRPELVRKGAAHAIAHGLFEPLQRGARLLRNAGAMFRRPEARPLSPVGVGARVAQSGRWDVRRVLSFGATLSVVVGLFNLLPVPGLDGGKLLVAIGEAAVRRRLPPRTAMMVQVGGALLLVAVWVALFVLDVLGA